MFLLSVNTNVQNGKTYFVYDFFHHLYYNDVYKIYFAHKIPCIVFIFCRIILYLFLTKHTYICVFYCKIHESNKKNVFNRKIAHPSKSNTL